MNRAEPTCAKCGISIPNSASQYRTGVVVMFTRSCERCGESFCSKHRAQRFCCRSCFRLKHGGARTRLYDIWLLMIRRCHEATNKSYFQYGARGVTVCVDWKSSFPSFRDWALSSGYADSLEIDRRDNDKGYDPANCRWVTKSQQNANRRHYGASPYKGVHRHGNFWRATIKSNGKVACFGRFKTSEEAARKYDEEAVRLYGEYAGTNFPIAR